MFFSKGKNVCLCSKATVRLHKSSHRIGCQSYTSHSSFPQENSSFFNSSCHPHILLLGELHVYIISQVQKYTCTDHTAGGSQSYSHPVVALQGYLKSPPAKFPIHVLSSELPSDSHWPKSQCCCPLTNRCCLHHASLF